jgi:hypothetical protein
MRFYTDIFIRPKAIAWDAWKTAVLPSVGTLGRLGRVFGSHAQRHPKIQGGAFPGAQQNDTGTCVPAVPTEVKAHRPFSEREWAILLRAGAENDPIIISALNLFDATVVE